MPPPTLETWKKIARPSKPDTGELFLWQSRNFFSKLKIQLFFHIFRIFRDGLPHFLPRLDCNLNTKLDFQYISNHKKLDKHTNIDRNCRGKWPKCISDIEIKKKKGRPMTMGFSFPNFSIVICMKCWARVNLSRVVVESDWWGRAQSHPSVPGSQVGVFVLDTDRSGLLYSEMLHLTSKT